MAGPMKCRRRATPGPYPPRLTLQPLISSMTGRAPSPSRSSASVNLRRALAGPFSGLRAGSTGRIAQDELSVGKPAADDPDAARHAARAKKREILPGPAALAGSPQPLPTRRRRRSGRTSRGRRRPPRPTLTASISAGLRLRRADRRSLGDNAAAEEPPPSPSAGAQHCGLNWPPTPLSCLRRSEATCPDILF